MRKRIANYPDLIGPDEPRARGARTGRPPSGMAPSKNVLYRLYSREGKSIREIGEALNCSKDMVARTLKAYGIEARTNVKRSQLRDFPSLDFHGTGFA